MGAERTRSHAERAAAGAEREEQSVHWCLFGAFPCPAAGCGARMRRYRHCAQPVVVRSRRALTRTAEPAAMTTPTRHNIPPEFLEAADEFVQLANRFNDKYPRDWVCAAMMYAAARYNAFVWVTREDNPEQSSDAAVAYFASEYDKMLRDNIDEIGPLYAQAKQQARQ
jgi:hypothetical protein